MKWTCFQLKAGVFVLSPQGCAWGSPSNATFEAMESQSSEGREAEKKATAATSNKGTDHKTKAFKMEAFAKSDPESFREYLKKQFLSNNISSKQISLLGRLVFEKGNSNVSDIARVASSRRCPGNAHRDLMRRFCRNNNMPSRFFAEIPNNGKGW